MKKGTVLNTKATAIENYLIHRREITLTSDLQIEQEHKRLLTIQRELGKDLLEVKTSSEVYNAIIEASKKKKTVYNGGYQDPKASYYKRRLGQVAKFFYTWANGEDLAPKNYFPINLFRSVARRDAYYQTPEQIKIFWDREDEFELFDRLVVSLLYDTFLRASELRTLKVKDIDLKNFVISIYQSKVERWKYPVFTERTRDLIVEWLGRRKYKNIYLLSLRPSQKSPSEKPEDKPISDKAIRSRLRVISKKLGYRMNPHSYRHGGCTLWALNDASLPAIKDQAGHTDGATTLHYTHIAAEHRKRIQKQVYEKAGMA